MRKALLSVLLYILLQLSDGGGVTPKPGNLGGEDRGLPLVVILPELMNRFQESHLLHKELIIVIGEVTILEQVKA